MMPKRITIITPHGFQPRYDQFTESVMGEKLHREGKVHVTQLTSKAKGRGFFETYNGVPTYRIPGMFTLPGLLIIPLLFLWLRPQVIHLHHFRSHSFLFVFYAKLFGIRTVFSEWGILHDDFLTDNREDPLEERLKTERVIYTLRDLLKKGLTRYNVQSFLMHWPMFNADKILFYSKQNIGFAKQIGLEEERLDVIPSYMDLEKLQLGGGEEGLSIPADKKVVFLLCQLKERKGYDTFLKIAAEVSKHRSDVCFVLGVSRMGKKGAKKIEALKQMLSLGESVIITHSLSTSARDALYRRASIYLMPSTYEGFGLPAIEAGHFGLLLVASDVPALNEYLVHKKNALLFKKGDVSDGTQKVLEALELSDAERETIKKEMTATCANFDINSVDNFTEVYLQKVT